MEHARSLSGAAPPLHRDMAAFGGEKNNRKLASALFWKGRNCRLTTFSLASGNTQRGKTGLRTCTVMLCPSMQKDSSKIHQHRRGASVTPSVLAAFAPFFFLLLLFQSSILNFDWCNQPSRAPLHDSNASVCVFQTPKEVGQSQKKKKKRIQLSDGSHIL